MKYDPDQTPTLEQLLDHACFKQGDDQESGNRLSEMSQIIGNGF